ncbi:threonine ammonia-lyase [Dyella koreensis]|uniref:Pyridoxal-phosphate dependent enzyme n=1 Tax=Dyella koreensis TaxID=311235 RepID=A0ABW8JZL2_9GAMM
MSPIADTASMLAAASHIDPVFLDSPLVSDIGLDAALGCQLLAKNETANPIGSFKGRGAELFAATALRPGEAVVCASAGNFGQGLAYAATRRGHACIVFAAKTANPVKITAMRRLGAEVHLEGADFDAAKQAARTYADASGLRFVEDGAEPAIAEGAGTIALELHRVAAFDAVLVPLGNGALLEGIGAALRQLAPATEIIAVVAQNAPAMKRSLEAGTPIETTRADTIADGIAVRVPIASRLDYLRRCCDSVAAVSEAQIFEAMRLIHQHLHLTVEPAGAVGIAAVLADPWRFAGRRIATVLCGGNLSDQVRRRLLALA